MRFASELKSGFRALAKTPGFTGTCLLVLSVGIAVSTGAFSVVRTMITHPLPFPNPERLALVRERNPEKSFTALASYDSFVRWREGAKAFEELGAAEARAFNFGSGGEAESVSGALATSGFFRALGWRTVLGRGFESGEEIAGGSRVVLISERCWERRFGRDPGVIGRRATIDGESVTIVGVLARLIGRSYYASYEIWAPLSPPRDATERQARTLDVVGLLNPGVAFAPAAAQLDALRTDAGWRTAVVPMTEITAHTVPIYLVLLAAVTLMLAIVCANIAMLQLARVSARRQEIALRLALGATRSRIVGQLLAEGVGLAGAAGVLGFVLTVAIREVLVASVPELAELRIGAAAFGFAALVSLGSGLLFGLSPALSASDPDINEVLKSAARTSASKSGGRMRRVLVATEMAIAATLLAGLGIVVHMFISLRQVDVGFRTDHLLAVSVALPAERSGGREAAQFYQRACEQLARSPEVESAAAITAMPLGGAVRPVKVQLPGRAEGETVQGQYTAVTPDHLRTMGIALTRGRPFGAADTGSAPAVAIVNQRAAALFWPGRDVIGQTVRLNDGRWRTVVGTIGDVRQDLLRSAAPEFYVPHAQDPVASMWVVVRTRPGADGALSLRSQLRALHPGLRISAPLTIDEVVSGYFPPTLVAGLAAFCAAALFLTILGLYGVVSWVAGRRTQEFGVRIALGAPRSELYRLVLREGVSLAGAGAVLGCGGGWGLSRLLGRLITGIPPCHPLLFLGLGGILSVVVVSACWLPARRAARVSPLETLRCP